MTTRAEIVAEARRLVGTPYHHQGRLPGVGIDCAGVLVVIGRGLGFVAPDFDINGYARRPDGVSLIAHCEANMERIDVADMQPGDVPVFRFDADPQHVGIAGDYVHGGLSLIHALGTRDGRGKVLEQRLAADILKRCVAAYRFPGVA
jgi:cell wall-associated NlpC family hydrolase